MKGTIVINADAGSALRKKHAALLATHVIHCMGSFRTGDTVHVVVLGKDGGQAVIATGVVRCDEYVLRELCDRPKGIADIQRASDDPLIVIFAQDVKLLWPSAE